MMIVDSSGGEEGAAIGNVRANGGAGRVVADFISSLDDAETMAVGERMREDGGNGQEWRGPTQRASQSSWSALCASPSVTVVSRMLLLARISLKVKVGNFSEGESSEDLSTLTSLDYGCQLLRGSLLPTTANPEPMHAWHCLSSNTHLQSVMLLFSPFSALVLGFLYLSSPSMAAAPSVLIYSRTVGQFMLSHADFDGARSRCSLLFSFFARSRRVWYLLMLTSLSDYRHDSIPTAIAALTRLAPQYNVSFTASEDPTLFTAETLAQFQGIVFLSNSGNVLDGTQREAFQGWLDKGGRLSAIHAGCACLFDADFFREQVRKVPPRSLER